MWSHAACVAYIAEILGVTKQGVYGIKDGVYLPSLRNALKIEDATNGRVTCRELLEFYDSRNKSDDCEVSACG